VIPLGHSCSTQCLRRRAVHQRNLVDALLPGVVTDVYLRGGVLVIYGLAAQGGDAKKR